MTIKQKKTLTLLGIIALILGVGLGTIIVVTRLSTTEESVAPTAPESRPRAAEWYGGEACNATFTIDGPTSGTINICTVIIDPTGKVVDGSLMPETNKLEVITSDEVTVSGGLRSDLDTPLSLGTDVLDKDGFKDAECVSFNNLAFGNYEYSKEVINPSTGWVEPRYYDYLLPGNSLTGSNLTKYGTNAYSDGVITLTVTNPVVTLVVLNQYEPLSCNDGCSSNTDCSDGLECVGGACRNPECSAETDCTCEVIKSSCNQSCTVNSDCVEGLICSGGSCRNPSCTPETDCVCPTSTPTGTSTPTATATPTGTSTKTPTATETPTTTVSQAQLPEAGISLPTLAAFGGGLIMVLLGVLLAL